MAQRADIFFSPAPGTDMVWLTALSRFLLDNGLAKAEFLTQWVNGLDEYRKSLEPFTMEFAAETCKVSIETLTRVGRELAADESACILWTMGVTQHCGGIGHYDGNLKTADALEDLGQGLN